MNIELLDKVSDKFFIRLLIDLISVVVLIRFVYFPIHKKKDYFFTYFVFNIIIFMMTSFMNKSEFSTGAAFGLFAVFSLLRYRTENISEKDMTYLFIVIAMGLISSVLKGTYFESGLIMGIIILTAYLLDGSILIKNEKFQLIQYELIENIKPGNREKLIADLNERTGLNIHKIAIEEIDFLRDRAFLKVYYYE
ncbi:MAG: DUF4956 domain-containing protein [Bacteroidetes bacterium]|nr:DUF4956 domain-containing protein [Bacteroidota bacterium]